MNPGNPNFRRRQVFIVAVESDPSLEPNVVRNYVEMSLKKYEKLLKKDKHNAEYFSNVFSPVTFHVEEINFSEDVVDNVRQSVHLIDKVRKALQVFSHVVEGTKSRWDGSYDE